MATAAETVEEIEDRYRKNTGSEKTILYEELLRLFERGFTDEEVFRNTIAEIDLLRKTYNRDTNDVMQAIMKALLVLPSIIIAAKIFRNYKDKLEQVLRKFQVLVLHFKKKKDAYKNYLRGLRLGIDILIKKEYLTISSELIKVLASVKEETDWAFGEIIDDLNAGLYGNQHVGDDDTSGESVKIILLQARQPAMYDDMAVTEEDIDSDIEKLESDVEMESDGEEQKMLQTTLVNRSQKTLEGSLLCDENLRKLALHMSPYNAFKMYERLEQLNKANVTLDSIKRFEDNPSSVVMTIFSILRAMRNHLLDKHVDDKGVDIKTVFAEKLAYADCWEAFYVLRELDSETPTALIGVAVNKVLGIAFQNKTTINPSDLLTPRGNEFAVVVGNQGGMVTSFMTRNYVDIRPNCVPQNENYVVWGRVITNYKLTGNKPNECLVSPVMEYHVNDADGVQNFQRHVVAVIFPVVKLSANDNASRFCVYLENDDSQREVVRFMAKEVVDKMLAKQAKYGELTKEQIREQLEEIAAFYTILDDDSIAVYTYHFSRVVCTISLPENVTEIDFIRGIVTAKFTRLRERKLRLLLEFFVHFVRAANNNQAYWQDLNARLTEEHRRLVATKDIILPQDEAVDAFDKLSVDLRIDDLNTYWTFEDTNSIPTTLNQTYDVRFNDMVRHNQQLFEPFEVAHYSLIGSDQFYAGSIMANITFSRNAKLYSMQLNFNEPSGHPELELPGRGLPGVDPQAALNEEELEYIQSQPWQKALQMCYTSLVKNMLDLNSIMDLMITEGLLTSEKRKRINDAHSEHQYANCDHPNKNRELLDFVKSRNCREGQTTFCVFVKGLLLSEQQHLAKMIADSLRIAWIKRDYRLAQGSGTHYTALRDYLASLETILLNYTPDAAPVGSNYVSPMQELIRNTWATANLTLDHLTKLLAQAFPHFNQVTRVVDDVYRALQRRDMQLDI